MAADANGQFYYLSLQNSPSFFCDLWMSTNGGMDWHRVGPAVGGDKAWMVIDTTTSPGRGNVYQAWDLVAPNTCSNRLFSRSVDAGADWLDPLTIPQAPYWGTLDVGPQGELYLFGQSGGVLSLNRSTDATDRVASPTFDLTTPVNLGGSLLFSSNPINPAGLLGQPWIAVAGSTYCVQVKSDLQTPWSASTNLACLMATNAIATLEDQSVGAVPQRFYRIVKQP